jgi:ketosteroid isomerase-like protein
LQRERAAVYAAAIAISILARTMSETNIDFIRRYFDAIEAGVGPEEMAAFFTPDVIQEEFPNRIVPRGARRELKEILAASKRGKQVMQSQRFEILHSISEGDEVALEVRWTGTLAEALSTLPAGFMMKARFAVFIRLVNGRIARQRNYDCFDAF